MAKKEISANINPEDSEVKNSESSLGSELSALLSLLISALLAFALWAPGEVGGQLGSTLSAFLHALMGRGAFLLPLFFLFLAAEYWKQHEIRLSAERRWCFFFLLIACLAFFSFPGADLSALYRQLEPNPDAWSLLRQLWDSGKNTGALASPDAWNGGFIGSFVVYALCQLSGKSGCLIFLIIMTLSLSLLVFDLSLRSFLTTTKVYIGAAYQKLRNRANALLEKQRENKALKNERKDMDQSENTPKQDKQASTWDTSFILNHKPAPQLSDDFESPEDSFPYPNMDIRPFGEDENWEVPEQVTRPAPPPFPNYFEQDKVDEVYRSSSEQGESGRISEDGTEALHNAIRPAYIPVKNEYLVQVRNEAPDDLEARRAEQTLPPTSHPSPRQAEEAELERRAESIEEGKTLVEESDRQRWTDRSEDPSKIARRKKYTNFSFYAPPPVKLLTQEKNYVPSPEEKEEIRLLGAKLEQTLNDFGIDAKVVNFITGPTISRFELRPGPGVKVSKIVGLSDDIALALAATAVRIEAPIPGKSAIGIEIPNRKTKPVLLRGLIESEAFRNARSPLTVALGRDIQGHEILCDLASMPHLLIAGATGSGKSVCINAILISLLYRTSPNDLLLAMIDPKVVELSIYNGIPHLETPVVTDPKKAYGVLEWAVQEMNKRYQLFAEASVRDFKGYNDLVDRGQLDDGEHLPNIVLVIDELSDLMATTPTEVETAISRLAAMARAAGIHLIIATQRPSVDVITGVIKANIPSRIAFAVASSVDSRTILDINGAEKLLGKGDMLYAPQSASKPLRGQGAFVTDAEVERVISYLKNNYGSQYNDELTRMIELTGTQAEKTGRGAASEEDELLPEALTEVMESGYASVSLLQRRLGVGHPRAARIVDSLQDKGWVGPSEGSKPRKLLITKEEYEDIIENWNEAREDEI